MKHIVSSADLQHRIDAAEEHYHEEKLGLGRHGTHEASIKAEEAGVHVKEPVSKELHLEMIQVAAYYIAEKRGFAGHESVQDWFKAEMEIDRKLH